MIAQAASRNDRFIAIVGIAHQGAGLDAERLGCLAGGDRDGGIHRRLDDDDPARPPQNARLCRHGRARRLVRPAG